MNNNNTKDKKVAQDHWFDNTDCFYEGCGHEPHKPSVVQRVVKKFFFRRKKTK